MFQHSYFTLEGWSFNLSNPFYLLCPPSLVLTSLDLWKKGQSSLFGHILRAQRPTSRTRLLVSGSEVGFWLVHCLIATTILLLSPFNFFSWIHSAGAYRRWYWVRSQAHTNSPPSLDSGRNLIIWRKPPTSLGRTYKLCIKIDQLTIQTFSLLGKSLPPPQLKHFGF